MKSPNKFLRFFLFISLFFFLNNCFEIFHYLQKNSDDTLSVKWLFTISAALAEGGPNQQGEKGGLKNRMSASEKELDQKFNKYITDLKVSSIENEQEVGFQVNYNMKPNKDMPKGNELDEGFPIVPLYDNAKSKLVFIFRPDKEKRKAEAAKKASLKDTKSEGTENSTQEQPVENNQAAGMEDIVNKILSGASYNLMLHESLAPKKITVLGEESKSKTNLEATKYGNIYMVRIPFMSYFAKEKKGFRVEVQF